MKQSSPKIELESRLDSLARDYRQVRYQGLAPEWPQPARRRWQPALAFAAAAGLVLAIGMLIARPAPQFGENAVPQPSPYTVLRQVRQSMPAPEHKMGVPLSPPRPGLPQRPRRHSGFSDTEPGNARVAPRPQFDDLA